jgi:hypothetical protein
MLLVLNTRDYDHKLAYGLNNIIMDANLDQIDRAKVDIDSVNAITRFSYEQNKDVQIEIFNNIKVKKNIITKDFNYKDDKSGVLFIGDLVRSDSMTKLVANQKYPEVFNKLGHFKQFTLRLSSSR